MSKRATRLEWRPFDRASPAPQIVNSDTHERSQWIAIGRLLRPQGRRGELLVERATDLPDAFAPGKPVRIASIDTSKNPVDTYVESSWEPTGRNAGRVVVKLSGVDSISDAELLVSRDVLIPAAQLPHLDEDTWFVGDLVGCILQDGERPAGRITGVQYAVGPDGRTRLEDAAPLLEVEPELPSRAAGLLLVPFVKAWIDTVDIEKKIVRMHLPEGLLALDLEPPQAS